MCSIEVPLEPLMKLKGRTAEVSLRTTLPLESNVPAVLPISRITELMEHAAARLMRPVLRTGESSVALSLDLTHARQYATSANLRAVAIHAGSTGRVHRFTVNVFDESGLVASAEHSRAVVAEGRIVGLARRRAGRRSMLLAV
jgi:fluoroacetyl-CoA thioesterase